MKWNKLLIPVLLIAIACSTADAFLNSGNSWKTAAELKGVVSEDLYELMECYTAKNKRMDTETVARAFKIPVIKEPVFKIEKGVVYTAEKVTRLHPVLKYLTPYRNTTILEGRCVVKVNDTHYRLIAAFYETVYLKKTVVMSAETPKDYSYSPTPEEYFNWFKRESQSCRILNVTYFNGTVVENPGFHCAYMNTYWDKYNPLTMGFAQDLKELIEREKLPKNAAIPIVVELLDVLLDYPMPGRNYPLSFTVFDPKTRSFVEVLPDTTYYSQDATWRGFLRGLGTCGFYSESSAIILGYLGLDVYDGTVDGSSTEYVPHGILAVNEKEMAGVKGVDGKPGIVTVRRDDGLTVKLHLLKVTDKRLPRYYTLYSEKDLTNYSFVQYNFV